ncbi:myoD family inhibitor domain-containing protein-like [Petromyzon marinus]|uniref:myoD family inhibitor domain-containing protein-like n=1 Tax=Petromyzon marinus TaxID=7757 RepID=UPI003F6E861A
MGDTRGPRGYENSDSRSPTALCAAEDGVGTAPHVGAWQLACAVTQRRPLLGPAPQWRTAGVATETEHRHGNDCCARCILACLFCEFLTLCRLVCECGGGAGAACCCCCTAECGEECDCDCGLLEGCCDSSDCLEICFECCGICLAS